MILVNKTSIYYVIFILAIGAGIFGLLFLHHTGPAHTAILHGSIDIPVSIADTEQSRDQGLSDTASLPVDAGMLFVFESTGKPGFWMKDMQYPLDFVWLNDNLEIVDITPTVAVDTFPSVFYPSQPIRCVLEVNAGFSTAHSLKIGQKFELVQK
jgi:uncharacterized membrane protein (UPF0127 family)